MYVRSRSGGRAELMCRYCREEQNRTVGPVLFVPKRYALLLLLLLRAAASAGTWGRRHGGRSKEARGVPWRVEECVSERELTTETEESTTERGGATNRVGGMEGWRDGGMDGGAAGRDREMSTRVRWRAVSRGPSVGGGGHGCVADVAASGIVLVG
ncbi:hypothetical protein B0J13DRAFT_21236 [Dactylonectria estremocensis]|uniref:Uncharacterized protein n=1 Tax=Dactylonectria estremocensis TaxID=1079267 RepID=A0A9P9FKP9_9HYPO|nr:hypothetical protein B0J13DRAFT_21236 [Dactylonectria estremocensis]